MGKQVRSQEKSSVDHIYVISKDFRNLRNNLNLSRGWFPPIKKIEKRYFALERGSGAISNVTKNQTYKSIYNRTWIVQKTAGQIVQKALYGYGYCCKKYLDICGREFDWNSVSNPKSSKVREICNYIFNYFSIFVTITHHFNVSTSGKWDYIEIAKITCSLCI